MSPGQLSSRWTFQTKFVAVPLYLLGMGALTVALFAHGKPAAWFFLAGLMLAIALRWRVALIKQVVLQDDTFRISNFREQHTVPVSQLCAVEASRWMQPELITLQFKRDTGFGKTIVFAADHRWFFVDQHPVADELRSMIVRPGVQGSRRG